MDINEAVTAVEDFLLKYRDEHDDWNPEDIRVRPSGDSADAIKVWFGFAGNEQADLEQLKQRAIAALEAAHPDLGFKLQVRAERFSLGS